MRYVLCSVLTLLALVASSLAPAAQQNEDDRGFLVRTLEDVLSSAGREVRIEGFRGALSSTASLDLMTIADDEGVWLTLRGATLDWRRAALLRGRVDVTSLTAEEIVVARLPAEPDLPSPEAGSFSLPELPVSIEIGQIAAARVQLGEPVIGQAVALSVEGSLSLISGRAEAALEILRRDGPEGEIRLALDFDETAGQLALDLALREAADGIAATMLDLPGRPSVSLSVTGEGPLDDFTADLQLATDARERLRGQVTLAGAREGDAPGTRRFVADLSGDVTALVASDLRAFFGPEVALRASGARLGSGAFDLERLTLRAASLRLEGAARLAPDGLPEMLAADLTLSDPGGGPVRLPLGGPPALVDAADLRLDFDAAEGPGWTGRFTARGFARGDIAAERLVLDATGEIARGAPGTPQAAQRRVSAVLDLDLRGLDLADPAQAEALGRDLTGGARITWQDGTPLALSEVRLVGRDYAFRLDGDLSDLAGGIRAEGVAEARIERLAAFAGLAGRPLEGRAALSLAGTATLLTGAFDLTATGETEALAIGQAVADKLIGGSGRLDLSARRDSTGTRLRRFELETPGVRAEAQGRIATGDATLDVSASITDMVRLTPYLSGPLVLQGAVRQRGDEVTLGLDLTGPAGGEARLDGTLSDLEGVLRAEGRMAASLPDLAAFSGLAGRPLRGRAEVVVEGRGEILNRSFAATLEGTTEGLALGQELADRLIGGRGTLSVAATGADDAIMLERLLLETPGLRAAVEGRIARGESALDFDARITDVARLTPDLSGPLRLEGSAREDGPDIRLEANASGPGGSTARIAGRIPSDGGNNLALIARGSLPLALADAALGAGGPRLRGALDFDVALDGPPEPRSVSGRVSTSGARVIVPGAALVIERLDARAEIDQGTARLSADAAVGGGGNVSLSGSVSADAAQGFPGDLEILLRELQRRERGLYRTTADGRITVQGPLAGGATIAGRIELGRTELRIPSSGALASGNIPEIVHRNEPADVRETRSRAGLIATAEVERRARRPYPLDLVVSAPNRIFLRGRGLDAELGGEIRLAGTTENILPSGRFELIRGRLDLLGRRLELTEGAATLVGDFAPVVRVVARSEAADGTTVLITVDGPAAEPEITFSSDPELPQEEVLARLFFGQGVETLSPLQAAQLASAVADLAGRGGGGVIATIRNRTGLDDLDIGTSDDGATTARVGKYITERVYTDVEVGSDGRSSVSINLDVTDDLRARGKVGNDSQGALGLFYERDY